MAKGKKIISDPLVLFCNISIQKEKMLQLLFFSENYKLIFAFTAQDSGCLPTLTPLGPCGP